MSPAQLFDHGSAWVDTHVLTTDTMLQSVLILAAGVFAAAIHYIVRRPLAHAIGHSHAPPRIKRLMHAARRLAFAIAWLILLVIARAGAPDDMGLGFINAVINLLSAWVVIRLLTQFIGNYFVRNILALSIWVIAALKIVGVLDPVRNALDHADLSIGAYRISALSVIKGGFALCILLYGAIFISSMIERRVLLSRSLSPTSKVLVAKLVRVALIALALLMAATTSGLDLSVLAALSGGLGLGLGFGLQKVVSNLFSGMLLLLDRSIKPGDIIEVQNGQYGWVEKMGARYTEIITRDNKSYLIPNENLITQEVINWSHGNTLLRVEVDFGVAYESDPRKVMALAIAAIAGLPRIVPEPLAECSLISFADSAITFKLFFWIKDAENGIYNIRSDVYLALWDAFKANGIGIPFPQRVVHVKKDGTAF